MAAALSDAFPVVTEKGMVDAERRLGFPLPTLLRRVLTELGNGGESLGGGLYGVPSSKGAHCHHDGRTMLEFRQMYIEPEDDEAVLLAKAVPICDLGDAQWLWLDCAGGGDGTILVMAGVDLFRTQSTFRDYWSSWLEGTTTELLFIEGKPRESLNPFTKQKAIFRDFIPRGTKIHSMGDGE